MKRFLSIILSVIIVVTASSAVLAHSGRTDASGGHRDNKNKSGLGSYHYHCGGNPAHLHDDGCPYKATPTPAPTPQPTPQPAASASKETNYDSDQLTVHFIDVGQGDSIFISLPNSETILVDAGGGNGKKVVDYLNELEISKIDYLIATHPHEDHIGGMPAVIREFEIGKIYMPRTTHTTKAFENLLDAIDENDLRINTAIAKLKFIDEEELTAVFIAPNSDSYVKLNNYSAVLYLEFRDSSFLFMGDTEDQSEHEINKLWADISADVIKIGHHGSDTSTGNLFLSNVKPSIAVISCGKDNSYGHPVKSTLDNLLSIGAEIYRTDVHGSIVISSDGKNLEIAVEKD